MIIILLHYRTQQGGNCWTKPSNSKACFSALAIGRSRLNLRESIILKIKGHECFSMAYVFLAINLSATAKHPLV